MNQEEEMWDDNLPQVQYHMFPLHQSSIFVVDTEECFEQFLDYIKVSAVINLVLHYFSINRRECFLPTG